MKENLSLLIEQFKKASGIENADINSQSFISEFSEWIHSRENISKNYLSLLEHMGLTKIADKDTAEIGKSVYDTIVKPFDTTIITPYMSKLDDKRIINAKFAVVGDIPVLFCANENGEKTYISSALTFMTQNPYTYFETQNWEKLHNSAERDIVVGVYGNIYDKDMDSKLEQIQELEKKLNGSYIREGTTIDDTYCYAIASERKVKTLVKEYVK